MEFFSMSSVLLKSQLYSASLRLSEGTGFHMLRCMRLCSQRVKCPVLHKSLIRGVEYGCVWGAHCLFVQDMEGKYGLVGEVDR